jgi:hypothetical protein
MGHSLILAGHHIDPPDTGKHPSSRSPESRLTASAKQCWRDPTNLATARIASTRTCRWRRPPASEPLRIDWWIDAPPRPEVAGMEPRCLEGDASHQRCEHAAPRAISRNTNRSAPAYPVLQKARTRVRQPRAVENSSRRVMGNLFPNASVTVNLAAWITLLWFSWAGPWPSSQ